MKAATFQRFLLLLTGITQGTSFAVTPLARSQAPLHPRRPSRASRSRLEMTLEPLTTFLSEQLLVPEMASMMTFPLLARVQMAGETALAASVAVAAAQGALIARQYATNPAGELIVPPGPTFGREHASLEISDETEDEDKEPSVVGLDDTLLARKVKKGWYQWLALLMPILATPIGAILRFEHLAHLAVVLGLAHIYDFFHNIPTIHETDTNSPTFGHQPHIVVLGDSMSVGIGCVNEFDPDKNSGILRRIEQLGPEDGEGPVFPRALAQSLSKQLGQPVSWRSAGVDGGDTSEIQKYLLPVIKEEVENNRAPDLVVVLTGSNDLKHILSNGASIRGFQSNLLKLARDIRAISPRTKVVFPALPTYRLDENSILNVFPLNFFLDAIIGFWDAQKIQAASSSEAVLHVDLKVNDVRGWYQGSETLLAADGIHPNKDCYEKWARHVGESLAEQLLSQRDETKLTQKRKLGMPQQAWTTVT